MTQQNELVWEKGKRLSTLSTFRIGGECRYYVAVRTKQELLNALTRCNEKNLPIFILGKGSNCLFDDRGFDGVVIHNKIDECHWHDDHCVEVGAGYSFSLLGAQTARRGWGGLEFASGIPGSVGGAVFMNAGANGSECCDVLKSVTTLNRKGEEHTHKREQLEFRYRYSPFHENDEIIVSARFHLHEAPQSRKKQQEIVRYRVATQPYEMPSAGCIFRNPADGSSGALIEAAGCKGERVGDAMVSEKHANFIVNAGEASAEDVEALIEKVQKKVYKSSGIQLEREVRHISPGARNA